MFNQRLHSSLDITTHFAEQKLDLRYLLVQILVLYLEIFTHFRQSDFNVVFHNSFWVQYMFIWSSLWDETPAKLWMFEICSTLHTMFFSTCKNNGLIIDITLAMGEIFSNQIISQMEKKECKLCVFLETKGIAQFFQEFPKQFC